jgi:hypothetical protein
MSRNVLVAIVAMLVFVVVAGAVYLEVVASAGAKDLVWEVSRSVTAGELLTPDNVQQQRVPRAGQNLDYFTGQLQVNVSRASHDMGAGTILFQDDVLNNDMALVNLTLRTSPQLSRGQTIDVYAQQGSTTVMVGRRLMVDQVNSSSNSGSSSNSSANNSVAVLVAAADEPYWISLQAGNVALFAARSTGIGLPQQHSQTVGESINALSGGATGGSGIGTIGQTPPSPTPTPSPTKKP